MRAPHAESTLEAYAQWAPRYPPIAHNPLMRAEETAMLARWPQTAGRRALDLACGTGRYANLLASGGAADVVALDFCAPMLIQVARASRVRASMMELPFQSGTFDVVVCGLALGHATDLSAWMAGIARVLQPCGDLLYSDFHAEAVRAGLTRSFKDQQSRTQTVPHTCFEIEAQLAAAAVAGLTIESVDEIRVGVELTEVFPKSDDFYRRWHGLPIVVVVRARK